MNLRDENQKPYPDQWLRDISMNFLLAGRDTTATLLTWTFYYLAKYPEILKKVVEEISGLNGEKPTIENMKQLRYIDYVFKESMRLRPPVPGTGRYCMKDDVLPDGTIVKPTVRVKYWPLWMHRLPQYWDSPEEFIPERWQEKNILKHSYQYIPFHAGPMMCLGRTMARLEAKTLLILILQKFRFSLDSKHEYKPFPGIITNCIGGAPMFVHSVK